MTSTDLRTGVVGDLGAKAPCVVASFVNLTLSGLQTVNGIALAANDRVLVRAQTDLTENGIYIASSSAWERAVDFDDELDGVAGTLIAVVNGGGIGQLGPSTLWIVECDDVPIQFGTSEIEFPNFAVASSSGGGTYLLSGNNLSDVESASTSLSNIGAQPLNAQLTALAALSSTGILARTAANTFSARTISGSNGISITDGDGVADDPDVSLNSISSFAASSSDQASASSNSVYTSPSVQQYHPSASKAWVSYAGTDSNPITPSASYNTGPTVTKNGTGDYTIAFPVPFSSTAYVAIINWKTTGTSGGALIQEISKTASSYRFYTTNTSGEAIDANRVDAVFFGAQ